MKYRLLDFLVCPDCGGELKATVFTKMQVALEGSLPDTKCRYSCWLKDSGKEKSDCTNCYSHEIESGILVCSLGHIFPIVDYIPRMLPDAFCGSESFIKEFGDLLPLEEIKGVIGGKETRAFARIQKNTQASFGYQWLRYDFQDDREDRAIFLMIHNCQKRNCRER